MCNCCCCSSLKSDFVNVLLQQTEIRIKHHTVVAPAVDVIDFQDLRPSLSVEFVSFSY